MFYCTGMVVYSYCTCRTRDVDFVPSHFESWIPVGAPASRQRFVHSTVVVLKCRSLSRFSCPSPSMIAADAGCFWCSLATQLERQSYPTLFPKCIPTSSPFVITKSLFKEKRDLRQPTSSWRKMTIAPARKWSWSSWQSSFRLWPSSSPANIVACTFGWIFFSVVSYGFLVFSMLSGWFWSNGMWWGVSETGTVLYLSVMIMYTNSRHCHRNGWWGFFGLVNQVIVGGGRLIWHVCLLSPWRLENDCRIEKVKKNIVAVAWNRNLVIDAMWEKTNRATRKTKLFDLVNWLCNTRLH